MSQPLTAQHPPAPPRQGQARWLSSVVLPVSPRLPSHSQPRWEAWSTRELSGDASVAAARVESCAVEPVGMGASLDLLGATGHAGPSRPADGDRARLVTCGLWLARRRLVAAVLGPSGEARRVIRAALTDEARFGLIEFLAAMEPSSSPRRRSPAST